MTTPTPTPAPASEPPHERTARLIQATAESLWDVSSTILATGCATEGDWELARLAASHLLVALQNPPATQPSRTRG